MPVFRYHVYAVRVQLRSCSHALFQIYCVFSEQFFQPGDILVTNDDKSLVSGMYLLNDSWFFGDISCSNPFFMVLLFHGSTLSDPFSQGYSIHFTTLTEAIYNLKRTVDDSRKFKGYCANLRKAILALLLEGACFFQRTGYSNLFEDYCAKCTKELAAIHSFIISVLI